MKIRIAAAGAALVAGLIMNAGLGTPASAMCLPLWGTVCRPATSPDTTATAPEAKPHKPLNLSAIAYRGHKRTHVAARHRPPTAAKQASRTAVTARAHVAAARRLASARRRSHIEARRRDSNEDAETALASRKQAPQVPAAAVADSTTSGTAAPPASQTDGYVPSQNEVTALDLAADQSKATPPAAPAAEAPNPALWNAVTPTDPAANAGIDPPADETKAAPAPNQVASAEPANAAEAALPAQTVAAAPPAQPPAEEPSWLRRILIGAGGVLTLASVVRLFIG